MLRWGGREGVGEREEEGHLEAAHAEDRRRFGGTRSILLRYMPHA